MGIFIKNNCDCCPPSVCEPCDPCAATSGTGTLYFKYTGLPWDYVVNWWQDAAATIPALCAPWVTPSPGRVTPYYNYNLTLATGGIYGPINYSAYINGGGTCDIYGVENNGYISGGTFTGDRFWNDYGTIWGGTFSGDIFYNDGYIYGGTWAGTNFINTGYVCAPSWPIQTC